MLFLWSDEQGAHTGPGGQDSVGAQGFVPRLLCSFWASSHPYICTGVGYTILMDLPDFVQLEQKAWEFGWKSGCEDEGLLAFGEKINLSVIAGCSRSPPMLLSSTSPKPSVR